MRFMIKLTMPVESANKAIKSGTFGTTMQSILEELKPEASYFFANNWGMRSGVIIVNMQDASQIPAIAEPFFLAFNASVEVYPVMSPEDLGKAGPAIAQAVEKYGTDRP
ncbi:MAG: hypothetical protein JWO42_4084 [Chloroflexi bacterium]|nr:hypothetical protein [Chloroflexota bacterium]